MEQRRLYTMERHIRQVERRVLRSSKQFDSSHAWFVGSRKNGKKLCVSVVVEAAGTGSAYAVPIAKKVFDAYW